MREQILAEIQRLTAANGGRPPGRRLFETQTGIPESAWFGVYWSRWGDAVSEAGFKPNSKNEKHSEELVFVKLAEACRYFKRIPAFMDLRLYKKTHPSFPNEKTIQMAFGGKANLIRKFGDWASQRPEYSDVANMASNGAVTEELDTTPQAREGLVYLIKSGSHYKIGRSDELERRVKEIRIALPESAVLVHSIRTDDPAGIEAYWHRRFADRRANGEWFKLSHADVAAFKKRRFQ